MSLPLALLCVLLSLSGLSCIPCDEDGLDLCEYQDHGQLLHGLDALAALYPKYEQNIRKDLVSVTCYIFRLASTGSIGKSVEGRDLRYIKISKKVHRRGVGEPMVKYVGNMHGDEVVGRQLIYYLANYLLTNYNRS